LSIKAPLLPLVYERWHIRREAPAELRVLFRKLRGNRRGGFHLGTNATELADVGLGSAFRGQTGVANLDANFGRITEAKLHLLS
jgi:hypothetical protein